VEAYSTALQGGPGADSKRRRAHSMPHKFKIGTIVNYYPKDRMLSTARGTYTITRLMPAIEGQKPEYRIKHFASITGLIVISTIAEAADGCGRGWYYNGRRVSV
jgi:hypothetical protein